MQRADLPRMRFVLLTMALSAFGTQQPAAAATDRPNILFIMSDDHAAHAIGAYGGRLAALNPTPNIDRLAREGMRLTNVFCTNSICVPSRASIITGQYCHTNGVRTLNGGVPPESQTLAHRMRDGGLRDGHDRQVASEARTGVRLLLRPAGAGLVFQSRVSRPGPRAVAGEHDPRFRLRLRPLSDAITDISLKWLKNRGSKDKPFFLMHHFKAPHDNFENAERYDWLYDDVEIPEPESLWQRGQARSGGQAAVRHLRRRPQPSGATWDTTCSSTRRLMHDAYQREAYQRYLKKYLRCVKGVDDNIGRLLDYLEDSGQLDNTIIIYTADQGFMLGEHDYIDKRWMYEESLRMPLHCSLSPARSGRTPSPTRSSTTSISPRRMLDLAGQAAPADMQGRSFLPILKGKTPNDWPTATYYRYWMHMAHHDNPAHYGLRTARYKLIFFYGLPLDAPGAVGEPTPAHWEFYDLEKDPHEMNNAYSDPAYAAVVQELKTELLRLKEQLGDTDEAYPELMEVRREFWD